MGRAQLVRRVRRGSGVFEVVRIRGVDRRVLGVLRVLTGRIVVRRGGDLTMLG
jgi:hypothetical protein